MKNVLVAVFVYVIFNQNKNLLLDVIIWQKAFAMFRTFTRMYTNIFPNQCLNMKARNKILTLIYEGWILFDLMLIIYECGERGSVII